MDADDINSALGALGSLGTWATAIVYVARKMYVDSQAAADREKRDAETIDTQAKRISELEAALKDANGRGHLLANENANLRNDRDTQRLPRALPPPRKDRP
jgi:small-conductance mechanosensitive channel